MKKNNCSGLWVSRRRDRPHQVSPPAPQCGSFPEVTRCPPQGETAADARERVQAAAKAQARFLEEAELLYRRALAALEAQHPPGHQLVRAAILAVRTLLERVLGTQWLVLTS